MRKFLTFLSRVLIRTAKTGQIQRQTRIFLSQYGKQPKGAWRLLENHSIKNSECGKTFNTKTRFFVLKESFQTTEKVGKSLEIFKKYLESKGFKLTFDIVKLALIGLALNNGNSDILFETISNTHETKEDLRTDSNILYSRKLESGFELISADKPVENEPYEEFIINKNEKIEENGVMVVFKKFNEEEIADDEVNKSLMQLLMLHLQENNNSLKLLEKSQKDFEALLGSQMDVGDGLPNQNLLTESTQDSLKKENEKLQKELDEKETQIRELQKQIEMLRKCENKSEIDDDTYKIEDEDDKEEDENVIQTFRKPRKI